MKTPAEKCAERQSPAQLAALRIREAVRNNLGENVVGQAELTRIIQSEYAPKSPDKCAEQAAAKFVASLHEQSLRGAEIAPALATIITESYAPTIQVAREAMEKIEAFHKSVFCGYPLCINGRPIDHTLLNDAADLARTALDQLK